MYPAISVTRRTANLYKPGASASSASSPGRAADLREPCQYAHPAGLAIPNAADISVATTGPSSPTNATADVCPRRSSSRSLPYGASANASSPVGFLKERLEYKVNERKVNCRAAIAKSSFPRPAKKNPNPSPVRCIYTCGESDAETDIEPDGEVRGDQSRLLA